MDHIDLSLCSSTAADVKTALLKSLMTMSLCSQGGEVGFHALR